MLHKVLIGMLMTGAFITFGTMITIMAYVFMFLMFKLM